MTVSALAALESLTAAELEADLRRTEGELAKAERERAEIPGKILEAAGRRGGADTIAYLERKRGPELEQEIATLTQRRDDLRQRHARAVEAEGLAKVRTELARLTAEWDRDVGAITPDLRHFVRSRLRPLRPKAVAIATLTARLTGQDPYAVMQGLLATPLQLLVTTSRWLVPWFGRQVPPERASLVGSPDADAYHAIWDGYFGDNK